MSDNKTALAYAVTAWLSDPSTSSGLDATQKTAVSNASQLLSNAFNVDPTNESQSKLYGGVGLQSVFDVFLKTQNKMKGSAQPPSPTPSAAPAASTSASAASSSGTPSEADRASAERLKEEGNKAMKQKDYGAAIAAYGEAIELHPNNPVYYSNRAAAFSQVGQHERAVEDARDAARVDPKFGKAYSRLGHALFASGKYEEAVEAYKQGLEVDPNNDLMQRGLKSATEQVAKSAAGPSSSASRDVDAGPAAGAGPGIGQPGGAMPDMASILNNPMMMQMAQNMMANGGLEGLMNNPMIRNMMSSMQSSGGMPDMSQIGQLMQDPEMRAMAQNLMGGGAGGQGGAGRGAGSSPDNNMYG